MKLGEPINTDNLAVFSLLKMKARFDFTTLQLLRHSCYDFNIILFVKKNSISKPLRKFVLEASSIVDLK